MKKIFGKIINNIFNSIPFFIIVNRKSYLSIQNILKGYNHRDNLKKYSKKKKADNYIPWMTYPFLDYIRNIDISDKTIFEYGSGNSTVFWSRNARTVVSVENNERWFQNIKDMISENVKLLLRNNKTDFINAITEDDNKYDIIILDGFGFRYECAKQSIKRLNPGGMIILDDSDNIYYKEICEFLKKNDLIQIDFVGLKPCSYNILSTSIFIRRDLNFKQKYLEVQPKIFVGKQRNYKA